jgi:hypothetical protein
MPGLKPGPAWEMRGGEARARWEMRGGEAQARGETRAEAPAGPGFSLGIYRAVVVLFSTAPVKAIAAHAVPAAEMN